REVGESLDREKRALERLGELDPRADPALLDVPGLDLRTNNQAAQELLEHGDQAVRRALDDLGAASLHPMDLKVALAKKIVTDFHGRESAGSAEAEFRHVFSRHEMPSEVEEAVRPLAPEGVWLPKLMVELGLARSNGEAIRLMEQGGVSVDGQRIASKEHRLKSDEPAAYLI